jgi:NAD(P)-dependent dehydrogenase (short-subunit alcohol dehydrogenase family)
VIRYPGIEGRVALVSGAAQGIGRAVAERLVAEGARVAVNDVNETGANEVATALGALAAPFDVAEPGVVRAGIERVGAELGAPELLVANHAFMTMAPFAEESDENWVRTLDVNLVGTANLVEACVPAMLERGYGRIVAISSEWGFTGWPDATAYTASKGGIVAYVRSCAVAFARGGVAVNAVAPGVTDTPQLEVDARAAGISRAAIAERYAADIPLGRIGRPEDVAALTAFLLSEPAAALVGQVLSPNGGTTSAAPS